MHFITTNTSLNFWNSEDFQGKQAVFAIAKDYQEILNSVVLAVVLDTG